MEQPQTFEMKFDLGNDAFATTPNRRAEVARLLSETSMMVANGQEFGIVYDVNGNTVGQWGLDPVGDPEVDCPGHVASDDDPKVCRHCGTHIDEYRDEEPGK